MPITFNAVLRQAGISVADVRLIRHQDQRTSKDKTPYQLWRNNRPDFERYQSRQKTKNRARFRSAYWAVFVVNLQNETMFVGLYAVKHVGEAPPDKVVGKSDDPERDCYELTLQEAMKEFIGKLFIEWGASPLSWVQLAKQQDKTVTELRADDAEPAFPGFLNFIEPLSKLGDARIPKGWIAALQSSRGVYLLTCPKTKEQYVGSATGETGFWGRWQDYVENGHADNKALKSRELSDYQVSILEVAGTSASPEDIRKMEGLWQAKLQSREMGLNRNMAYRPPLVG